MKYPGVTLSLWGFLGFFSAGFGDFGVGFCPVLIPVLGASVGVLSSAGTRPVFPGKQLGLPKFPAPGMGWSRGGSKVPHGAARPRWLVNHGALIRVKMNFPSNSSNPIQSHPRVAPRCGETESRPVWDCGWERWILLCSALGIWDKSGLFYLGGGKKTPEIPDVMRFGVGTATSCPPASFGEKGWKNGKRTETRWGV